MRNFWDSFDPNHSSSDNMCRKRLNNLGFALDEICRRRTPERTSFPSTPTFTKKCLDGDAKVEGGKFYIAHVQNDDGKMHSYNVLPVLLSICANTEQYLPLPTQILFCSAQTSFEELMIMLNRCQTSKELHSIVNVEQLQYDVESQFEHCLSNLSLPKHSKLAIVCSSPSDHPLLEKFATSVHKIHGMGSDPMTECIQLAAPDVLVISSDLPGLGKTEEVLKVASERDLALQTIPISGNYPKDILVQRMAKIKSDHMLHLDVNMVEDTDALDAFFFEFFVLKGCKSGTNFAQCSSSAVIEIGNTHENSLRRNLYLINYFKTKYVTWSNFDNLHVSQEINSPIQIVCLYLEALEENTIGREDLVIKKGTGIKALTKEVCIALLKKQFAATPDMSFSIMNVFLDVLSHQLKQFSSSFYFRINFFRKDS